MLAWIRNVIGVLLIVQAASASAVLNIEIIGAGEHQIPVAVVPFGGDAKASQAINEVVVADLARTGLFRLIDVTDKTPHDVREVNFVDWQKHNVEALAVGTVTLEGKRVEVKFQLLDAVKQTVLDSQGVSSSEGKLRAVGHRVADLIYEKMTGNKGVFSTRIAYVNRQGKKFSLVVADSDGQNEQALLTQNAPIMSPAWSSDGSKIAYVSFAGAHAVVYIQSVYSNQRTVIADSRGSNSAPAWSPDGKQLAVVIGREGSSQIYLVTPEGKDMRRITTGGGIDTEPNFSPDGQSLLFTSDRGGTPQIYQMPVAGGAAKRMTFGRGNHYSPRYSPNGKSFVFTHQAKGKFYIAKQDIQSGQMELITGGGWEKKPSFSPNGKVVMYASELGGRGILATVSSDGRVKQKMSTTNGDAREPIWGPRL
ncbi:MAG: Tol-Pal system beta propeller repeat protein TolB [Gallionella sp.]|nr:Tol-Pal system protein TolB [Gallionella sp.]